MDNLFLEGYDTIQSYSNGISKDIFAKALLAEHDDSIHVAAGELIFQEAMSALKDLTFAGVMYSIHLKESGNMHLLNEGFGEFVEKVKSLFKKLIESIKAFFSRIWMKVSNLWTKREEVVKKDESKIRQGANYTDKDGDEKEVPYKKKLVDAGISIAGQASLATIVGANGLGKLGKLTNSAGIINIMAEVDKDGKLGPTDIKALADADKSTYNQAITTNENLKVTRTAIADFKESLNDEISAVLDDSNDVKLSTIIDDCIKFYTKATRDSITKNKKTIENLIKSADKAKKEFETLLKDSSKSADATKNSAMLQAAYMYIALAQFVVGKSTQVIKSASDEAWSKIETARSNYTRVVKQRNLGENANVGSNVLSKFGFNA